MTRKDFEAIAKVFRDNYKEDSPLWLALRDDMMEYFYTTNPRFDLERFLQASEP